MNSSFFDFSDWLNFHLNLLENELKFYLNNKKNKNFKLSEVLNYAVFNGGKRLRPLLVLASSQATNGQKTASLKAAVAVELIHSYSLVHDDLPCMDNDNLRRGKPTAHVVFGESLALLAGDTLQSLAFEVLTSDKNISFEIQAKLCQILAIGSRKMAFGQSIDLLNVGQNLNEQELKEMHNLKTGALLTSSVLMGAVCSENDEKIFPILEKYSQNIGLAFQIIDDILDVTASKQDLGKTPGKDLTADKPTYVKILGLDKAKNLAKNLVNEAVLILEKNKLFLSDIKPLKNLAYKIIERKN